MDLERSSFLNQPSTVDLGRLIKAARQISERHQPKVLSSSSFAVKSYKKYSLFFNLDEWTAFYLEVFLEIHDIT